jgi:hypothetical protein
MTQEMEKISLEQLAQEAQEAYSDSMRILEEKKSLILGLLDKKRKLTGSRNSGGKKALSDWDQAMLHNAMNDACELFAVNTFVERVIQAEFSNEDLGLEEWNITDIGKLRKTLKELEESNPREISTWKIDTIKEATINESIEQFDENARSSGLDKISKEEISGFVWSTIEEHQEALCSYLEKKIIAKKELLIIEVKTQLLTALQKLNQEAHEELEKTQTERSQKIDSLQTMKDKDDTWVKKVGELLMKNPGMILEPQTIEELQWLKNNLSRIKEEMEQTHSSYEKMEKEIEDSISILSQEISQLEKDLQIEQKVEEKTTPVVPEVVVNIIPENPPRNSNDTIGITEESSEELEGIFSRMFRPYNSVTMNFASGWEKSKEIVIKLLKGTENSIYLSWKKIAVQWDKYFTIDFWKKVGYYVPGKDILKTVNGHSVFAWYEWNIDTESWEESDNIWLIENKIIPMDEWVGYKISWVKERTWGRDLIFYTIKIVSDTKRNWTIEQHTMFMTWESFQDKYLKEGEALPK